MTERSLPHGQQPNMIGDVYGELKIIADGGRTGVYRRKAWLCRCQCGKEKSVAQSDLRNGDAQSCGCLRQRLRTKHGGWKTPEYAAWTDMRGRCHNPNDRSYKNYGQRGITVCERWGEFTNFQEDMGSRPTAKHTLERIDNNKGYSPDNCKWATRSEQQNNRRNTLYFTLDNETKTLRDWCQQYNRQYMRVFLRLQSGYPFEIALKAPIAKKGQRLQWP